MKIARNVAVFGRHDEWERFPAPSLRELSRPMGVTEGVSPDEWERLNILSFVGAMKIARNVAVFEWHVEWERFPAPSLRELLSAAKLRECRPMVAPCRWFTHQRIQTLKLFTGYVHRSTLPQSRIRSTAPSGREPGNGVPFNRVLANVRGCGRFSSPLRNSEELTFIIEGTYL